jgi:hypothetical protein
VCEALEAVGELSSSTTCTAGAPAEAPGSSPSLLSVREKLLAASRECFDASRSSSTILRASSCVGTRRPRPKQRGRFWSTCTRKKRYQEPMRTMGMMPCTQKSPKRPGK